DDLYAEGAADQELGVSWQDGTPTLSLWAPTAKDVTLQLHGPAAEAAEATAAPTEIAMERGPGGVWTAEGDAEWTDQAYTYAVQVYVPELDEIATSTVTDPYSVGLTVNSQHSVVLDLEDPRWAPEVWTDTPAPVVDQFADQTIYEMHLRDFSAGDEALPAEVRGSYAAFGHPASTGTALPRGAPEVGTAPPAPVVDQFADQTISEMHLRDFSAGDEALPAEVRGSYAAFGHPDSTGTARLAELAAAGMTTVHLLPTFDIA